jgi:hypothetical protein
MKSGSGNRAAFLLAAQTAAQPTCSIALAPFEKKAGQNKVLAGS